MTTAQAPSLATYIEELNDLPPEILLGRIVVFTIHDNPVRLADIEQWFTELNLDKKYVPLPNKQHDAFKKATKELDGQKYPMTNGRTGILLCRDVQTTNDYIVRSIVREIRDSARRKLTHIEAINCMFTKAGGQFQHPVRDQLLEPEELIAVKGFARQLAVRYQYHQDYLDAQKVRAMVRDYLKSLNSVEIKPGVYYVNCNKDDELHRLAELVNRIGGGCHMNLIPIVNIKREREFISRMFEREAADELSKLTRDIEELMRDRHKISPKMYAKMKARYAEVMAKAEEHTVTLDISQAITSANAEVVHKALTKLELRLIQDGD